MKNRRNSPPHYTQFLCIPDQETPKQRLAEHIGVELDAVLNYFSGCS